MDVYLGLDVDGRDGCFSFEGMDWGGFEGGTDKVECSVLHSF